MLKAFSLTKQKCAMHISNLDVMCHCCYKHIVDMNQCANDSPKEIIFYKRKRGKSVFLNTFLNILLLEVKALKIDYRKNDKEKT